MRYLNNCLKIFIIIAGIVVSAILAYTVNAQTHEAVTMTTTGVGGNAVGPGGGVGGGIGGGLPGTGTTTQSPMTVPGITYSCRDSVSCLKAIAANTFASLLAVSTLPTYLESASKYISNWTDPDKSESTKQIQGDFTQLGNQFITNSNAVNTRANIIQLAADLFHQPVEKFTNPQNQPDILKIVPNVNDLSYGTVINLAPVEKGATISAYNYLKNAGGIDMNHPIPQKAPFWGGRPQDITTYTNYFNTISSVMSYNTYILDFLVAENANGNLFTPTQNDLISQASSGTWLATVATEELGMVLRQILMYQSQAYILLTQLLQTQKQMLVAQVMSNSLLIATNGTNESIMIAKAQGVPLS